MCIKMTTLGIIHKNMKKSSVQAGHVMFSDKTGTSNYYPVNDTEELGHVYISSPHTKYTCLIISRNTSIVDDENGLNELHKAYETLHNTLLRLKKLREKIITTKKNFYFYRKLLDTLLNDMKSPCIVIIGCPQLPINQLYLFFAKLSKRLHIRFNDTNIELILQNRNKWRKTPPHNLEPIPIVVKLKTSKIKNLYLNAVKRELKLSETSKKFGFSIHFGNDLLNGIFVNEHLTEDKLLLYRYMFREAKKYGYLCFINNSNIYIKKSALHKPIVVNSRHVLRVINQKQITQEIVTNTAYEEMKILLQNTSFI